MNQLHLLRLMIPTFKTTIKTFQGTDKTRGTLLKTFDQFKEISLRDQKDSPLINPYMILPVQPEFKLKSQIAEDQTQQTQLAIEKGPFLSSNYHLEKNNIDHRVKSTQYQANGPCEDTLICEQLKQIDAYAISVFDGHGGPELAEFSKNKVNFFINNFLRQHLKSASYNPQSIGTLIKQSLKYSYKQLEDKFFQIYEQQLKIGNKKIRTVGTCGITAIVHNDRVYIGNSGDSQGMFIVSHGQNMMKTEKTNERLCVNNRAQREKIINQWKDIDDQVISQQSENCYYLKGRLQPTRTIGDYYLKKEEYFIGQGQFKGPYLSCDPEITEFQLTPAHKYMVIASDGLWDVLSRNQVMTSMMNGKEIDLTKTCYQDSQDQDCPYINSTVEYVLQKCCEKTGRSVEEVKDMQKGKRRNYHDDITIAVVDLDKQL